MPNQLYDAGAVKDKTLIATKDLPVYDGIKSTKYTPTQVGIVKGGNPAGTVYSYVDADAVKGITTLWWIFYPGTTTGSYYYMPHHVGDFDVSALRQQGVISVAEQIAEEKKKAEDENKTWYEKAIDKVVPIGVGVIIAVAIIKGVLSRKS